MTIIRPVAESDQRQLEALSELNGQGLTDLPRDANAWQQMIARSMATFARTDAVPQVEDVYLFVLEDRAKKQLLGTCQIIGKTAGSSTRGHYYHLEKLDLPPLLSHPKRTVEILRPVQREPVVTEVGGLFLNPTVRAQGLSKLTSLSRFLFMAIDPNRFCPQVISEIRGRIDENRISPFWNALGRHFWDIDYKDVMQHLIRDPSLASALMSPIPVYRFLFSPALQASIGQAHALSQIAMNRLLDQGFRFSGDVDPCDGGPKLIADLKAIRILHEHQYVTVGAVKAVDSNLATRGLIANDSLQFRAYATAVVFISEKSIEIDSNTAEALQVGVGARVRFVPGKTESARNLMT